MKVEIITPDKSLYNGEASMVSLPGTDGSLGILNNHAPIITTLQSGIITLKEENGTVQEIEVAGGTVEVLNNVVTILAE